uniref:Reverse transcriptase domain-containing protein n=1 Tax=Anolis carolinensis TaxID=28377 RepID=A0A803TJI5_ANOCA
MDFPRRLMDPNGFLMSLGDFPVMAPGDPVEALVDLYNIEMARAVDTITPERPLSSRRVRSAPWFSEELAVLKRMRLECIWRRSQDVSNQARARASLRAYSVALQAARKVLSTARIASATNRSAELFQMVGELLHPCDGGETDYLDPSQSGFRPGHGTEMTLVALVDDLRKELDKGCVTLLILLDISAAFYIIDHGILLGWLSGMGIRGVALTKLFLGGLCLHFFLG